MTAPVSRPSSKWQIWMLGARPKTLPASVAPVVVAGVMAYTAGRADPLTFGITLLTAVLIQIGTNLANDYFDFKKGADHGGRTGPLRIMQAGLVSPLEMRRAITLVLGAALLLGIYLVRVGGVPILSIGVLSLLFAILYTAGPWPLAYIGLGDLFVLIFFGPVATGGAYYLLAGPPTSAVLFVGFALGSISTAILAINNLRDVQDDRRVGKRTLAVRFGKNFTRCEFLALLTIGTVVPLMLISVLWGRLAVPLASLYLIAALPVIRKVFAGAEGAALNEVLAATGRLLLLFSLLFCVAWGWAW